MPAQEVLALGQRHQPSLPGQAIDERTIGLRKGGRSGFRRLSAEGVADPMDGPYEARVSRLVGDRGPDLGHQVGQVGLQHVGVRPEKLPQLRLGQDAGSALQERLEQLEGLGRQVDGLAFPQELPRLRVQYARPEEQPQALIMAHLHIGFL